MEKEKLLDFLINYLLEERDGARDPACAFHVGEKVFIRTVTHHLTGEIVAIRGVFLVLKDAAWIADDGRFMQAINRGDLNEIEPVDGPVRVNSAAIIDVYEWRHPLPRGQK